MHDAPIRLLRFADSPAVAEPCSVAPDRRIAGDPRQAVWNHYTDPTGRFSAGIWESGIGKWRIAYTEHEYCELLEGTCIVTGADGHATTLRAGDRFVIPRGFTGTWEVVERARKVYVIFEDHG